MARFCRYCGSPVREGANFCKACGCPLTSPSSQPAQQELRTGRQPQQPSQQTGYEQPRQPIYSAASVRSTSARQKSAQMRAVAADAVEYVMPEGQNELVIDLTPPADLAGTAAEKVLGPISGILHGIGSYIGGIFRIFKNPLALIGTIAAAVLWYFLAGLRDSDSEIVKILSWLTYAEGGFDRGSFDTVSGVLGAVGGVLGKGTVAAALISLLSGGLVKAVRGFGALFKGHGEKRSVVSVLFGIVIGGAVYFAFAGKAASADTAMAGIAGVLLSLEALGGSGGKLYALAQSLTSRASNGVRTTVQGKCDGLLTGLTVGFALATVLSALGILEGLL